MKEVSLSLLKRGRQGEQESMTMIGNVNIALLDNLKLLQSFMV